MERGGFTQQQTHEEQPGALTAPGAGGSPAGGDRAEGFQLI